MLRPDLVSFVGSSLLHGVVTVVVDIPDLDIEALWTVEKFFVGQSCAYQSQSKGVLEGARVEDSRVY